LEIRSRRPKKGYFKIEQSCALAARNDIKVRMDRYLLYRQHLAVQGGRRQISAVLLRISLGFQSIFCMTEQSPADYAVACRMSWASRHQTTRIEDTAHCLLGHIRRPHVAQIRRAEQGFHPSTNQHHYAAYTRTRPSLQWTDSDASRPLIRGLLADSPGRFQGCFSLESFEGDSSYRPLRATPQEVEVHTPMLQHLTTYRYFFFFFLPVCSGVGISLRKVGVNTFARTNPNSLDRLGQR